MCPVQLSVILSDGVGHPLACLKVPAAWGWSLEVRGDGCCTNDWVMGGRRDWPRGPGPVEKPQGCRDRGPHRSFCPAPCCPHASDPPSFGSSAKEMRTQGLLWAIRTQHVDPSGLAASREPKWATQLLAIAA